MSAGDVRTRASHRPARKSRVARDERSETRGWPFRMGRPVADFAALNPGYGLRLQGHFPHIAQPKTFAAHVLGLSDFGWQKSDDGS
jgi:hypothetical protein